MKSNNEKKYFNNGGNFTVYFNVHMYRFSNPCLWLWWRKSCKRPIESSKIVDLEKQIRLETQYDGSYIDKPRNYELDNCNGLMIQEVSLDINNENLKNSDSLIKYVNNLNLKIQKIFPYDKKCYYSVVIQTQYFDAKLDSTINNRFSFPMIK